MKDITICVDFDGTIVDHAFPEIGKPVPGAIKWLELFQSKGAKIILWTMRSDGTKHGDVLTQAIEYLSKNGIAVYASNQNPDQKSWTNSPKALANIYIDDSAIGCPLLYVDGFQNMCVDWDKVSKLIKRKFPECFESGRTG